MRISGMSGKSLCNQFYRGHTVDLHTAFDSILSVFPSHPDFRSFANEYLPWCYPYSITNWP
ncbi:hypothetical protein FSOLCH5_006545 [Fusarium solani]